MDKNIPQHIVEKIEEYVLRKTKAELPSVVRYLTNACNHGYLLAQSENDNLAVEFAEWLAENAEPMYGVSQWRFKGNKCTTQQLFTQFKKSK